MDAALGHFHMDKEHYQAYNCACIYRAFQSAGGVSGSPQAGALVIFQDYRHVGRVTEIKDGRVYTNEGNTSALYGDSNGGTVREKNSVSIRKRFMLNELGYKLYIPILTKSFI